MTDHEKQENEFELASNSQVYLQFMDDERASNGLKLEAIKAKKEVYENNVSKWGGIDYYKQQLAGCDLIIKKLTEV